MPNGASPGSGSTITSRSQGFFYSVPHALIREQVDTRPPRARSRCSTAASALPLTPRRYGGPRHRHPARPHAERAPALCRVDPERFQRQARDIGPNTEALIIAVLARRPHPEQGFRTCLGVLRLFRGIDAARAEAVSLPRHRDRRAVLRRASPRSSSTGSTSTASPQAADGTPLLHDNIRGSRYFH